MRFLLLAALCLFAAPANATTVSFVMDVPYISEIWTLDILGFTNAAASLLKRSEIGFSLSRRPDCGSRVTLTQIDNSSQT